MSRGLAHTWAWVSRSIVLQNSEGALRRTTGWRLLEYVIYSLCSGVFQTDEGLITQAVLHQLATHTLSLSFFATHYGSLTDDFAYHPNIRNMHMKTMVDDEKQEVSRTFITHAKTPMSSFRSLKPVPYTARLPIQVGLGNRFFLVWYARCLPRGCAYHGGRPGRCGLDGLREAFQGEDRGEEEAGPIVVDAPSGLCVFDGIGDREGQVAGGRGKSAGGIERLEGSGEDGTASRCYSKGVDPESPASLTLAACLL
jgi:hypothetical protein